METKYHGGGLAFGIEKQIQVYIDFERGGPVARPGSGVFLDGLLYRKTMGPKKSLIRI
jgi:hypothetical protein